MKTFCAMALTLFMATTALAMDGDDVAKMLRSRVDEPTIIRTVQHSRDGYRMSPGEIDRIRRVGGSEYLIRTLCALSRPPVAYRSPVAVAPVVVQPAPIITAAPGTYIDKDSTAFQIVNRSGRDFSAEINHSNRRIILRDPSQPGMRLSNFSDTVLTLRKGTWKIRAEGYSEDGEVKMRGGERTVLRLERSGHGANSGVVAQVDDSQRVRAFTLIPEFRPVVVAPAPVVVQPAPVVVQQPTYVVERNPVIVTPAPIIRPAPTYYRPAPPVIMTPHPGMPPVVVPPRRPGPPPPPRGNSTGININFSYGSIKR